MPDPCPCHEPLVPGHRCWATEAARVKELERVAEAAREHRATIHMRLHHTAVNRTGEALDDALSALPAGSAEDEASSPWTCPNCRIEIPIIGREAHLLLSCSGSAEDPPEALPAGEVSERGQAVLDGIEAKSAETRDLLAPTPSAAVSGEGAPDPNDDALDATKTPDACPGGDAGIMGGKHTSHASRGAGRDRQRDTRDGGERPASLSRSQAKRIAIQFGQPPAASDEEKFYGCVNCCTPIVASGMCETCSRAYGIGRAEATEAERERCAQIADDVEHLRSGYAINTVPEYREIEHHMAEAAHTIAARIRQRPAGEDGG